MHDSATTTPIPEHVELDVVVEVLTEALDDMNSVTVDIGHITGDDEGERNLSLTADRGTPDSLAVTLWDEDHEDGPTEIGSFVVSIRRVI